MLDIYILQTRLVPPEKKTFLYQYAPTKSRTPCEFCIPRHVLRLACFYPLRDTLFVRPVSAYNWPGWPSAYPLNLLSGRFAWISNSACPQRGRLGPRELVGQLSASAAGLLNLHRPGEAQDSAHSLTDGDHLAASSIRHIFVFLPPPSRLVERCAE